MKSVHIAVLLAVTVFSAQAFAADKSIVCTAQGTSLSSSGSGFLPAYAHLSFVESQDISGLRVLRNIEGTIHTADGTGDLSTGYIGHFKTASVTETLNYRPRRYVGFSKFAGVNAADTQGSAEDGMWGDLIVEKDTAKASFEAHYIFKAGDHMGGTLDMTCVTR